MCNRSDELLSKLSSLMWFYSFECNVNGLNKTLLIKYIVNNDYYALMMTDMTRTYFECIHGDSIDAQYKHVNKGSIKREKLMSHIESILSDVTKVDFWSVDILPVDSADSHRLSLRVQKPIIKLKFEWRFHLLSTNSQVFRNHVTDSLLALLQCLHLGVHQLVKENKKMRKQLDQLETMSGINVPTNSRNDSDQTDGIKDILSDVSQSELTCFWKNPESLLDKLLNDGLIVSALNKLHAAKPVINLVNYENQIVLSEEQTEGNGVQEETDEQTEIERRKQFESHLNLTEELEATATTPKKSRIKL